MAKDKKIDQIRVSFKETEREQKIFKHASKFVSPAAHIKDLLQKEIDEEEARTATK